MSTLFLLLSESPVTFVSKLVFVLVLPIAVFCVPVVFPDG